MTSEPAEREDGTARASDGGSDVGGLDRRAFMRSALVVGGAGALSSVLGIGGVPDGVGADGDGPVGVAERANRQHAWDDYERFHEGRQQSLPPAHHLLLHVDYAGTGAPTAEDRRTVEAALRGLERRFPWSNEGLLFTVGYTTKYFERFGRTDRSFEVGGEEYTVEDALQLPKGLVPKLWLDVDGKPGLLSGETLLGVPGVTLDREDPVADGFDAVVHVASDEVANLLMAEQMLWDEYDPDVVWEGVAEEVGPVPPLESTVDGVFTRPESYPARRVGFVGHENVETRLSEDTDFDADRLVDEGEFGEHPSAELSMGINDLYRNSIPRETNVTMLEDQRLVNPKPPGAFAQGTIQHVSKVDVDLTRFYDENVIGERRRRLLSAGHDISGTGAVGEKLGRSNAPGNQPMRDVSNTDDADKAERTVADFEDDGVTGHAQKCARARFDLESRITDAGIERLTSDDREELLPAEERRDSLPGHDGVQEAEPVVLRRDFVGTSPSEPGGNRRPGNHFVALMRFAPYMTYLRRAMNGVAFDTADFGLTGEARIRHEAVGDNPDSGIVNYLETRRRQNYLVPPLTMRALPHPSGERLDVEVSPGFVGVDRYSVTVRGYSPAEFEDGSVQFGWYYDVNRQRGVDPIETTAVDGGTRFLFPADEMGLESVSGGPDGRVRARLFARHAETLRPLRGIAELFLLPENLRRFDTDGEPGIQAREVLRAVAAYNDGDSVGGRPVTIGDVVDVLAEYNS